MKLDKYAIDKLIASGGRLGPKAGLGEQPAGAAKPNKYHAKSVEIDGKRFASGKEGERYLILKIMQAAGEICDLECHPVFRIVINGIRCGRYTADFRYKEKCGAIVVEDVKGDEATRTEAYRLRKRIVEALHGITITEV